jgi:uncharacterized protein YqgC (DUF456 family)
MQILGGWFESNAWNQWLWILWLLLLCTINLLSWTSNLLSLPGNWLIVLATAVYAYFFPETEQSGIGWMGVGILVVLAILGEIVEFVAGAAMAGKRGASRRAMALAVVGTMVGSIAGAMFTIPIPILGPVIGALAGGAAGSFCGAWLGELWKGKSVDHGVHVGTGALLGRLLGTSGKLIAGAAMCVVAAVDAFY